MQFSIPILLYHHVSPDRDITPSALEEQLRFLLDKGYESLSMDEVSAICAGTRVLKGPAFAVTFDDGYLDNWLCAFPVLARLKVKAAFYLVTDYVEDHSELRVISGSLDTRTAERSAGGFLSWQEARAAVNSGWVTIGSHTLTHRHFIRRQPYADLKRELVASKKKIESRLGKSCVHLAWPWGDFETDWLPLVKDAGYQTAVTTLAGSNHEGSNALRLHRLKVSHPGIAWLEKRMAWNRHAWSAAGVGLFYGWDRRFKTWLEKGSPYSHG